MTLYEEAEQIEEVTRLMDKWLQTNYVKSRGMTRVEVNHWLRKEGVSLSWRSIILMLERLVQEGRLVRTTTIGGQRVAYPPYLPAYVYWPKEAKEVL